MKRKIIQIDEEKCNGCGACAAACHEGAINMVNGKAHLMRDDYCDALGDCLPSCPTGAITFTEREAAAYDQEAVLSAKARKAAPTPAAVPASASAPMSAAASASAPSSMSATASAPAPAPTAEAASAAVSELSNWPVQIKLAPTFAPYFDGAHLLVAADCTAFSRADFHERYMKGRVVLVGCPKLDAIDYSEKLASILSNNDIVDVTVLRMEVPCCGGLEYAVSKALQQSDKNIPCRVVTLATDGDILSDEDSGSKGGVFTSCPSCSR